MQDYYPLNLSNHNQHHHGLFVMGQLQNGRRIECARFQPVDMTKILGPLPESVKRCYGCTCPDGFVDCKRVNEAVECQLTPKPSLRVPQPPFHKAPMQQPHNKPRILPNTAKLSEIMGIDLEDKYKKYAALGAIRFTTRTAPTRTTTMLPPTTTSTTTTTTTTTTMAPNINEPDYEDGSQGANGSPEVTDAKDMDHFDDDEYSSTTPAPASSTTITISSTTTDHPTIPHIADGIVTKSPDLLPDEKTWDDVSDGISNTNGNSNSVIVAEQFISKPALFGDEMRVRNQHYRSYMSSQENNWRSINGETMAKIGIIVYIILLVIVLLAMTIICIATKIKYCSSSIEKQKQHQQEPPSLKLEPLLMVKI